DDYPDGIHKTNDNDREEDQRAQKRKPDLLRQEEVFIREVDYHEIIISQQVTGKQLYLNAISLQLLRLGEAADCDQGVKFINDPQIEALGNPPVSELATYFFFDQSGIEAGQNVLFPFHQQLVHHDFYQFNFHVGL